MFRRDCCGETREIIVRWSLSYPAAQSPQCVPLDARAVVRFPPIIDLL